MEEEILEKIISLITNKIGIVDITKKDILTSKFDKLGLNSLDFVRLLVEIEDALDIEFLDEQLGIEQYDTVQDLFQLIITIINR